MGPTEDVASKLEAKTASFVKEHRLPGAAVGDRARGRAGVVRRHRVRRHRRAPGSRRHDPLPVASITKTFTGTAIMQLRDEGLLHLDDPAVVHLPELRGAVEPVRRHRDRHDPSDALARVGSAGRSPRHRLVRSRTTRGRRSGTSRASAEIGTTIPPNTQQKYSNLAYQLLGEIVARRSGMPYVEYVRTRILEPLGMNGSGFESLPEDLSERSAIGYAPGSSRMCWSRPRSLPRCGPRAVSGRASRTSARWLSFQLREDGGSREGAQMLAGSSLKEMHKARYLGDDAWTEALGISWYAVRKAT